VLTARDGKIVLLREDWNPISIMTAFGLGQIELGSE
jgi:hypothetical protein